MRRRRDARLPLLRRAADDDLRRSRRDAARQLLRHARGRRAGARAALSAARAGLRRLLPGPGRRPGRAGGDLLRLRLFLVDLGFLGRARAALRRGDDRALRARAASQVVEIASNDGYLLQHFLAAGVPVARHRAGRQRRGGGASQGRADRGRLLRPRDRRAPRRARRPRRPDRRQQRAGACARHPRLRRRLRRPARRRRRGDLRVPAPAQPDPRRAVRHDLPRAFLVSVADRGRGGVRRLRPQRVRRRGTADPWRLAAPLRLPRRRRPSARPSGLPPCAPRSAPPASTGSTPTAASRRGSRR